MTPRSAVVVLPTLFVMAACDAVIAGAPGAAVAAPPPSAETALTHLALGQRRLEGGRTEEALKSFDRSLALEGISEAALVGAGASHFRLRHLVRSQMFFERAVDLYPGSIPARNNLGVVLYQLGDLVGAQAVFAQAVAMSTERAGRPGSGVDAVHVAGLQRNLDLVGIALARAAEPAAGDTAAIAIERLDHGYYLLKPTENAS